MLCSDLLVECHDLVALCAPELVADVPLYVMALPEECPRPVATRAFASTQNLAPLRAFIESRGLWRGPGRMIAFCQDDIGAEDALGIALHEAAHLLPAGPVDDPPHAAELIDAQVAAFSRFLLTDVDFEPTPCEYHGADFLRICCHLQHRAKLAGFELPFPALVEGWHYQRPPLVRFARVLGDEPDRMLGCSFAEILSQPAPAEFLELSKGD